MHMIIVMCINFYNIIIILLFTGVDLGMPTVRNPDRHMYIREWSGGILAGCFELNGRPCFQDGIPDSFEFQLLPEDWDHIRKILHISYSIIIFAST